MTCTEWIKGVHRLGRARYVCAHCGEDVSLDLVFLSAVIPDDEMPPVLPMPKTMNTPYPPHTPPAPPEGMKWEYEGEGYKGPLDVDSYSVFGHFFKAVPIRESGVPTGIGGVTWSETELSAKLTTEPAARKGIPLARGVLDYFPDALCEVAKCSLAGNEQHHAGEPLHWDKTKSTDEADALMRHLIDRGTFDKDSVRHSAKVAWRALAMLQRELDAEKP